MKWGVRKEKLTKKSKKKKKIEKQYSRKRKHIRTEFGIGKMLLIAFLKSDSANKPLTKKQKQERQVKNFLYNAGSLAVAAYAYNKTYKLNKKYGKYKSS